MFITEGRTAGVFVALAIAAGPVLVGSLTDRADRDPYPPSTSVSDQALSHRPAGQAQNVIDGRDGGGPACGSRALGAYRPPLAPLVGRTEDGQCPMPPDRTGPT